jgi:hypothetical protein
LREEAVEDVLMDTEKASAFVRSKTRTVFHVYCTVF